MPLEVRYILYRYPRGINSRQMRNIKESGLTGDLSLAIRRNEGADREIAIYGLHDVA